MFAFLMFVRHSKVEFWQFLKNGLKRFPQIKYLREVVVLRQANYRSFQDCY